MRIIDPLRRLRAFNIASQASEQRSGRVRMTVININDRFTAPRRLRSFFLPAANRLRGRPTDRMIHRPHHVALPVKRIQQQPYPSDYWPALIPNASIIAGVITTLQPSAPGWMPSGTYFLNSSGVSFRIFSHCG